MHQRRQRTNFTAPGCTICMNCVLETGSDWLLLAKICRPTEQQQTHGTKLMWLMIWCWHIEFVSIQLSPGLNPGSVMLAPQARLLNVTVYGRPVDHDSVRRSLESIHRSFAQRHVHGMIWPSFLTWIKLYLYSEYLVQARRSQLNWLEGVVHNGSILSGSCESILLGW